MIEYFKLIPLLMGKWKCSSSAPNSTHTLGYWSKSSVYLW